MEIKIGTVGTAGRTVTEKDTALAVKSGSLQVLATPVLSALMEEAAVAALAPCLPPKQTTVGGFIAVRHNAPTPVGQTIKATATVTAVKGNVSATYSKTPFVFFICPGKMRCRIRTPFFNIPSAPIS